MLTESHLISDPFFCHSTFLEFALIQTDTNSGISRWNTRKNILFFSSVCEYIVVLDGIFHFFYLYNSMHFLRRRQRYKGLYKETYLLRFLLWVQHEKFQEKIKFTHSKGEWATNMCAHKATRQKKSHFFHIIHITACSITLNVVETNEIDLIFNDLCVFEIRTIIKSLIARSGVHCFCFFFFLEMCAL